MSELFALKYIILQLFFNCIFNGIKYLNKMFTLTVRNKRAALFIYPCYISASPAVDNADISCQKLSVSWDAGDEYTHRVNNQFSKNKPGKIINTLNTFPPLTRFSMIKRIALAIFFLQQYTQALVSNSS